MTAAPKQRGATRHRGYIRAGFVILGLLWFIWIGIEDPGPGTVLFMAAAALSVFGAAVYGSLSSRLPRTSALRFASLMFMGLLVGLLVTPGAVLLMAVKTSLHNHAAPDFTRSDVLRVLASTPAWSLGGLLLSTAAAILERVTGS
jgi:hypothetical protein